MRLIKSAFYLRLLADLYIIWCFYESYIFTNGSPHSFDRILFFDVNLWLYLDTTKKYPSSVAKTLHAFAIMRLFYRYIIRNGIWNRAHVSVKVVYSIIIPLERKFQSRIIEGNYWIVNDNVKVRLESEIQCKGIVTRTIISEPSTMNAINIHIEKIFIKIKEENESEKNKL